MSLRKRSVRAGSWAASPLFAMAWAIARAAVQSITVDEAITYNIFVFNRRFLWYAANNHILNSTLMYGFTRLLGLSQLTARLPALIGAAFYITAVYRLCRLLGASLFVQLTLFVCLVFNPFIFDYLVAARGYGLALGFLMWAIVYSAEAHVQQTSLLAACAVSSLCAGLSVDANFSFAFVNLAAMTAILVCAWRRRPKEWTRLLAACVLPGAAVFAIVSGYALLHTHPGELIYGATSLGETFGTVIDASLFQSPLDFLSPIVFPLVGVTGLLWLLYAFFRSSQNQDRALGMGCRSDLRGHRRNPLDRIPAVRLAAAQGSHRHLLLPAFHDRRPASWPRFRLRRGSAGVSGRVSLGRWPSWRCIFCSACD